MAPSFINTMSASHLRVQLHHADVVVHHRPVVARVYDDGAHPATLAVSARMVEVVQAQHHLPQLGALPPDAHIRVLISVCSLQLINICDPAPLLTPQSSVRRSTPTAGR